MNTSRAICTLETMAIDMVGTLGGLNKANPIAPVLERQIEAISMAQDALRAVRDFATDTNVGHIDANRMNEIMQAEREGRLVILPCKVGDTVYALQYEYCDRRGRDMCNEYCDGWDVHCPDYEGETDVYETKFDISMIAELGKTVFLSRDEAEKALEEAK